MLKLLAAVKEEFQKYGEAVQKARTRLEQASGDLDAIDTRARARSTANCATWARTPPPLRRATRINLGTLAAPGRLRGYT